MGRHEGHTSYADTLSEMIVGDSCLSHVGWRSTHKRVVIVCWAVLYVVSGVLLDESRR